MALTEGRVESSKMRERASSDVNQVGLNGENILCATQCSIPKNEASVSHKISVEKKTIINSYFFRDREDDMTGFK